MQPYQRTTGQLVGQCDYQLSVAFRRGRWRPARTAKPRLGLGDRRGAARLAAVILTITAVMFTP